MARERKPVIAASVKMRPLFWTKIVLDDTAWEETEEERCVWAALDTFDQAIVDFDEVEQHFSQKVRRASAELDPAAMAKATVAAPATFEALDSKRAQSVGILMGSSKVDVKTIAKAVYKMDAAIVTLDKMKSFYELRGTPEELDIIKLHEDGVDGGGSGGGGAANGEAGGGKDTAVPLAPATKFVLSLTTIHKFNQRMLCWIFKESFEEKVLDIVSVLEILACATQALSNNPYLDAVLGVVLTVGNYLNGGTKRGRADGFNLDFLPKLKDVKTKDNSSTLIDFVATIICSQEKRMGTPEATMMLPPSVVMLRAAENNFDDLLADMKRLEAETEQISRTVDSVVGSAHTEDLVQPFKDDMEEFIWFCKVSLEELQDDIKNAKAAFDVQVTYYRFKLKSSQSQVGAKDYFGVWATFLADFEVAWESQQRKAARAILEKAQAAKRAIAEQKSSRKAGGKSTLGSKLKSKFSGRK